MKTFFRKIFYQPLYNLFIFLVAVIPGHSIGWAIIALTVLVRLVLTPLKYKTLESQMKQKALQPELKALQERHKDDRQAQSMAMMQLYKDKGVNPASGCVPMLIQFPLLIVLIYVFRSNLQHADPSLLYSFIHPAQHVDVAFLWLKDLTKPDHTFILPILAGVVQFLYSKTLMASQPTVGNSDDMAQVMNKQMMYMAPALTVLVAYRFAAALSLYWAFGALLDWLRQMWAMRRYHKYNSPGSNVTVSVRKRQKEAL